MKFILKFDLPPSSFYELAQQGRRGQSLRGRDSKFIMIPCHVCVSITLFKISYTKCIMLWHTFISYGPSRPADLFSQSGPQGIFFFLRNCTLLMIICIILLTIIMLVILTQMHSCLQRFYLDFTQQITYAHFLKF